MFGLDFLSKTTTSQTATTKLPDVCNDLNCSLTFFINPHRRYNHLLLTDLPTRTVELGKLSARRLIRDCRNARLLKFDNES